MTGLGAKTKAILAKMIWAQIRDWPTPDMGEFLDEEGCSDEEAAKIVSELAEIATAMGLDLRPMAAAVAAGILDPETDDVAREPAPRDTLPN
jgi:hypothetical protein